MNHDKYISPFSGRYAGEEMQYLFSQNMKFRTFRKLWCALAQAEKLAGLNITDEQIAELNAHTEDINYEAAEQYEKELRHDVMAHIKAYGDLCPTAKPIIHLGATSCFVGDNTDMIIMRDALSIVRGKLLSVIRNLRNFALQYKDLPTLGYTHLQPAQLTTVGKRATLWLYDLTLDLADLDYVKESLALLGSKGATGTQASFADLFDGDEDKIKEIEEYIQGKFGFNKTVPVSGQTYTRKFDSRVLSVLSGIAQSAYKFSNDLRLLSSFKEMEEPFEEHQIGSSAMPYKRNPMRCERMGSLARYVICDLQNTAITASTQWFERTLDDSANKRISVSEAFLAIDAVLNIYINVTSGMRVYEKTIRARIMKELPFMASENILMEAVVKGGDRQELHERLRIHSVAAGQRVKEEGLDNDLPERIASDPAFGLSAEEIRNALIPEKYTGMASSQTDSFIKTVVDPLLSGGGEISGNELTL